MKKLILIFIAGALSLTSLAQDTTTHKQKKPFTPDRDLSRWVLDINFIGGPYMQNFTTSGSTSGYLNEIGAVSNNGTLKFKNGSSFGGDAQIGLFFGHRKHWGIGTGFLYMYQQGDAELDNFSVQYQSTDKAGNTFRQIVTGDQVKEHITSNNMNIPLLLKYKNRWSKHWGFTADAGALFNLQMKNKYTNSSSFDYEAIYAQDPETKAYVFDASPTPGASDALFTKASIQDHLSPGQTLQGQFSSLYASGFNVGLGVKPNNNGSGNESYTTGSVGLLLQPSVNYFFSDHVALNMGLYYIYQPFKNSAQNNYALTNTVGDYSSVTNNVTASKAQTYGLNLGLRFFLGGKEKERTISRIDSMAPTLCGNCDGVITLHGFKKNKKIKVDYDYNGTPQKAYEGRVDADGNVVLKGLCAGSYTNIKAKIRHRTMTGYPVNIVAPTLVISSENPTNATAAGKCDATISFTGLYAGKAVVINYNFNGTPQPAYNGTVAADNTVTITGLCAGSYTGFVASINTCTANGTDVTLTEPAPPAPPTPTPATENNPQRPDISQPILFNFNKATVHKSSIPLIKEAAEEMKADPNAVITVNGYTDAIGSKSYNKKLSVKRAKAVKADLKKYGVNPKRVKVDGHGKSDPAATNATPEGRSENRRGVMDLEDKK